MLKNLLIAIIVIVQLSACKSHNAFSYSEEFVKEETKLIPYIEAAENSIEGYITREHYDSVAIDAKKIEIKIDSLISNIKTKPAPDAKLGEKFKVDIIKYFEYFKSVYSTYVSFGNAPTPEDRNEEITKMQNIVSKRETAISKIQESQKLFAAANGFRIEK